jgi:hypothetical protein
MENIISNLEAGVILPPYKTCPIVVDPEPVIPELDPVPSSAGVPHKA